MQLVRYHTHYLSAHLLSFSTAISSIRFHSLSFHSEVLYYADRGCFSTQNSFAQLTFLLYIHFNISFISSLVLNAPFLSLCSWLPLLTLLPPLWSIFFPLSHYLATALVTLTARCRRCTGGRPHQAPALIHHLLCRAGMSADTNHSVSSLIYTFRRPLSNKNTDKKMLWGLSKSFIFVGLKPKF